MRRLSARHLRTFAPDTMNREVRCDAFASHARAARRSRDGARPVGSEVQLEVVFDWTASKRARRAISPR
jgi:hypothetical protein